ncbi:unnamed protein product [Parascedosporium putredinis]|uniref:F-box domain-containing protein n=1 Tax=Parascedosporium putredinis TaxID=1442378 RepID=A0A9P1H3I4_9PEZI|nr:unnamed protein product [Parascedosporium putredinis]CAI7995816.1 unnamed protein product [Parascedosporium putredinis]
MSKATLGSLPIELHIQILSYLDLEPPSYSRFTNRPTPHMLDAPSNQPLKSVSQHGPRRRATLDDDDEVDTQPSSDSLLVNCETLWETLFSAIDPLRFSIISRPARFGLLLALPLDFDTLWSYGSHEHVLSFARDSRLVMPSPQLPASDPVLAPRSRIFTIRPWTATLLNEGCNLGVYKTALEAGDIDVRDLWLERNASYAALMTNLFAWTASTNWRSLRVLESGDTADKQAWDLAAHYMLRGQTKKWAIERDGVFVWVEPDAARARE